MHLVKKFNCSFQIIQTKVIVTLWKKNLGQKADKFPNHKQYMFKVLNAEMIIS